MGQGRKKFCVAKIMTNFRGNKSNFLGQGEGYKLSRNNNFLVKHAYLYPPNFGHCGQSGHSGVLTLKCRVCLSTDYIGRESSQYVHEVLQLGAGRQVTVIQTSQLCEYRMRRRQAKEPAELLRSLTSKLRINVHLYCPDTITHSHPPFVPDPTVQDEP